MPNLNLINRVAPFSPEMARIPTAVAVSGLSRTRLYGLAAQGLIRMVKAGPRCTLVDMQSVREYQAHLPEAQLRGRNKAA